MKPRCFGIHSDQSRECQICDRAIECWKKSDGTSKGRAKKTGPRIAILRTIAEEGPVSAIRLKKVLEDRFDKKAENVHYYLNALKREGRIRMIRKGRQRLYKAR